MAYIASITIPFENCSYVVKIQADEIGITGMRDALILDRLHKAGEVEIEEENIKTGSKILMIRISGREL